MSAPDLSSVTASRTTGAAPLGVIFDASQVTGGGTTPFKDNDYFWVFGDFNGQTWTRGPNLSHSKNCARGPVAAHCYETAGTYTWRLVARGGGLTTLASGSITVTSANAQWPTTQTICFTTGSQTTGGPTGATYVTGVTDLATSIAANIGTGNVRLLLNSGDVFRSATAVQINQQGPGMLGIYGTGAAPVIKPTVNTDEQVIYFSSPTLTAFADWRFVGLEIDGSLIAPASNTTGGIADFGSAKQVTMLRMNIHDVHGGGWSIDLLDFWNMGTHPGQTLFDQMFVQDCTFSHGVNGAANALYITGTRMAFLGNSITDMVNVEHALRSPYASKAVYSFNNFSGAAAHKHLIKQHAGAWSGSGLINAIYSENIVISENTFSGGLEDWLVSIGPQDPLSDERVRTVLIENNYSASGAVTQVHYQIAASAVTVRNVVMNLSGSSAHTGIMVQQRGIEPVPTVVDVLNVTAYSGDTDNDFIVVELNDGGATGNTAVNVTVKNVLAYAPNDSAAVVVHGTGASGLVTGNNTNDNGGSTPNTATNPVFASTATLIGFRSLAATNTYPNTGGASLFPTTTNDLYNGASNDASIRRGAMVAQSIVNMRGVGS